ncbi:aspartate ammonia-lyase [Candidatus Berkiella aquae]|uniref:Fumarate hydratase class II n=1 Tax=Candidatus Berkiella aquae TaxID=295108 RepID=A0A0Q9YKZ2_9GAMM|nr:class II fumarate hydratase [Candidatus Berkiella aquae]MCS5710908.1 class II fumarate hydratase [Candidatus Berkiella aquae]
MSDKFRIVKDSMGDMKVPVDALYGAQTQRAIENFPISGIPMPRGFIEAMGLIKGAAAKANADLKLIDAQKANAIIEAANAVAQGKHDASFPIDVFQTGSGTSTNMNANEVIAELATRIAKSPIHPNDDVNMSQSSNDVIPTAIHVSASIALHRDLLPALKHLQETLEKRANELKEVVKTGRTHLMDAMPVTLGQELGGYAAQIAANIAQLTAVSKGIEALVIGGTAVGTGINAHPEFGQRVTKELAQKQHIAFTESTNRFASMSSQDAAVALSGQLKTTAVSLMKIANDLRWMNSGPLAGLGEIALPSLQPGSSIMPGKVNPVIPEAMTMICAQVIGNDTAITIGGQSGNFQLNVMLPMIAHNLLQSLQILSQGARLLADKAIAGFTVNQARLEEQLSRNPILVTALNTVIGYELGAKIAKTAYAKGLPLMDVAKEMTDLSEEHLKQLLDPALLTKGGIPK